MRTPYITNIALLLLILGLYWFINHDSPVIESNQLSSLSAKHVTTIQIKRLHRDDIVLQKQGASWFIQKPIQANANTVRVNLILDLLSSVSYSQLAVEPNLSLQQFELESAPFKLLINDQQFEFGSIEPLSKNRYIRHNNIIHLINDNVAPLLNANAASFIDNRLIANELHISKISLPAINDGDTLTSALSISLDEGHWQSSSSTLSPDKLSAVIQAWQHAYALQVKPLSKENIKQAVGQYVSFEFKPHSTLKLLLQFDEQHISLIDFNKQLQYQFPLAMKEQFFPIQDSKH